MQCPQCDQVVSDGSVSCPNCQCDFSLYNSISNIKESLSRVSEDALHLSRETEGLKKQLVHLENLVTKPRYIEPAEKQKTEELKKTLIAHVRTEIGPIASPDHIQWADGLPKTRSGKIMRRVLRKIAAKDYKDFVDLSPLAEPAVVDDLIERRKAIG